MANAFAMKTPKSTALALLAALALVNLGSPAFAQDKESDKAGVAAEQSTEEATTEDQATDDAVPENQDDDTTYSEPTAAGDIDADDFASKFAALFAQDGTKLEFGDASVDGDTITYDGLTVTSPDMDEPLELTTAFTFSGVAATDNGGYTAEAMTVPDVDYDIEDANVTVSDINVGDILLPGGTPTPLDVARAFGSYGTGEITYSNKGAQVFSIGGIEAQSEFEPDQGADELTALSANFRINDIAADLSAIDDPEAKQTIDALGITSLNADFVETADWAAADGRVNIGELSLTAQDLGAVNFTADISGLTPDVVMQMVTAGEQVQQLTDAGKTDEASAVQTQLGMQILQKLSLNGMALRYEDASLAGKVLDFMAAQQGVTTQQMVDGLKMSLPAMLSSMNMPDLAATISTALTAFLDDPQSLEISVAPDHPVTGLEAVALASQPAMLVNTLKLSVTANQ